MSAKGFYMEHSLHKL